MKNHKEASTLVPMAYRNIEPLSKQFTIVVGLTVVGFMAFGLALSFYRNAVFEKMLDNMKVGNEKLTSGIRRSYGDLEYYRSAQYKDKYAKENLGRVQAGEKVLIITQKDDLSELEASQNASITHRQEAAYLELLRQMPVIEHWEIYLFAPQKIEDLQDAI